MELKKDKEIKCILFDIDKVLISEIIEIDVENIGDPNCKLVNPFLFSDKTGLEPWPSSSTQRELIVSSDKILTIANPKKEIIEKYLELTS